MRHTWTLLPRTVATRLYLACAFAGFAAISISGASLHFTHRTRSAVEHFHTKALPGLLAASDLALLLERHRRIVEAAPLVMDRLEIDRDRSSSERIIEEIDGLIADNHNADIATIRTALPALVEQSRKVLYLAANYAQAGALVEAEKYTATARSIEGAIRAHRQASLRGADEDVAAVAAGGRWFTSWVLAATLAIMVIVPPAIWMLNGTVRRLRRITRAMLLLARNETDLKGLPEQDDDEVGDMARAVAVFRANAMQLMQQRSALQVLNQRFDIALGNMSHGLSMFDYDQRLVVSNDRYARIYDLPPELTVPGTRFADILANYKARDGETKGDTDTQAGWIADFSTRVVAAGFTDARRLHNGRLIQVTYRPIDGGGWVDVHEDITEKKEAEERIGRLAREDTLTGVANRHAFGEALRASLSRSPAASPFAIHWIDLDRFKEVNDVHGHPKGDALLVAVSRRITASVRSTDFVARLGGDEFAVIQCDVRSRAEAEPLARRLIDELSGPYLIQGHAISIGASIGIALSVDVADGDPEVLLHNADIALYQAKSAGRGTSVLFRSEIEAEIRERRALENDLRRALGNDEFELHYQPIIDLASREVNCCEALLRWRHPVRGSVPPGVFIPIAEELGLISEIGSWVLRQACAEAQNWPEHVGVAVNLSAQQFEVDDVLAATRRALSLSGLCPSRLELEVTESLLMADKSETIATLLQLRDLGVGIALDDFGTGYASLSYLRSFPFDKIKIDQSFVRELPDRAECFSIVSAVCEMARSLGMRTVAEGVETIEHIDWVKRSGCDLVQGYHFSRPVPAREIGGVMETCGKRFAAAA